MMTAVWRRVFNVIMDDFLSDREVETWIDFGSVDIRDRIRREDFGSVGTSVQDLYEFVSLISTFTG